MKQKLSHPISSLGEFAFIDHLTRRLPIDSSVIYGVGDDCAVLKKNRCLYELFTTDMSIEGVHFNIQKTRSEAIGYKALARNVSDIAAMGGIPTHAVVAFGLPPRCPLVCVERIFYGIKKCAALFSINIVGGDVSKSNKIIIAISMLGEVERKNLITRSGARVGDRIYVTGTLGGSLRKKHAAFMPRIHEARFLTRSFPITSMIDISDGLVQDLGHILRMSGVGCVVNLEKIPIAHDALIISHYNKKKALHHALVDGEDFELLFTVSPKRSSELNRKWKRRFPILLTAIGTIIKEKNMYSQKREGLPRDVIHNRKGYTHF